MVNWQGRSTRKASGAKLKSFRGKRRYEMGRTPASTTLGAEPLRKMIRVRGGSEKVKLIKDIYVNVTDPQTKKTFKLKILDVVSNNASLDLHRKRIITRGAIVKTEKGNVRITSRPGQHGTLNGVIVAA
ncbi:MAG: 30S ribosomal protein S8e [Candidatus Odinarchaeota archaeon]